MSKRKTVRISSTTTPQIAEAIELLLWSGFWGNTKSEVINRLISHAVRDVMDPDTMQVISEEMAPKDETQLAVGMQ